MTTMTTRLGELRLDNVRLTVPLTTDVQDKREIEIFARIVTRPGGEDLPYLFFLQGGPGNEAPRPCANPASPSWLSTALKRYRVVMVDQRGTGLSTPVNDSLLETGSAHEVAEYMSHLRADGIVRDCEALREELGVQKISLLGQSFGGFTTLHYLTAHPDSLDRVFLTGGLSAVGRSADDVYSLTYEKMAWVSEQFYRRFPAHRERVRELVAMAGRGEIVLPDGEVVSESRMRSVGHMLGMNDGWLSLHYLLELDPQSNAFRYDLAKYLPYDGRNPIYYVMHESSYADGVVTNWSAERCLPQQFVDDTSLFFGEHVFSDWSRTVPAFQPWSEVTEELAQWQWPKLYDAKALRESGARGAAAVYVHDAYVPLEFSMETGALLPEVELYISSVNEHNGLRTGQGEVLRHLFELADGSRVR